jgi:RNA polymerase sigma factor (sigma-70 family)
MNTTTTLTSRIQELEPRLRRIANQFASDPMDADDIFSEMVEAILNHCEPDFSDAKILTKAKWVAYDHVNSVRIYTKYIGDANDLPVHSDDDPETYDVDFEQVTATYFPNPEQAVIEREEAAELFRAVSQLSPTLQLIVSLLSKGYKPVEIADKMGISKSAVSQNISRISTSLTSSMA